MKRRNRELSVFGMSSLDLFASALGAFILISVIIFPYITGASQTTAPTASPPPPQVVAAAPTTEAPACPVCPSLASITAPEPLSCPVCPTVPATEPMECPVQAPLQCPICPTPDPSAEALVCPAAPPAMYQFPHLDLIIVLDVTSSMGRQVASLKTEVGQLSDLLSQLSPSLGIGMVAFGDRSWERPLTIFPLRQISGPTLNRAAFRGFVNGLNVMMGLGGGMNLDPQEAFLQALTEATRMPARPEAQRRVIVMVTDYPAYPEEVNASIATAANVAQQSGHQVSTVYINTTGAPNAEAEAFLQSVAAAGGGQYVRDVGGSLTVNLLLSLL
ncbi:MAG: VWA domain-containing protein [Gammaproteobacteria bacterium]|nr:VWA domain-containing protein [Gammaproteobacteria bacterium]MDE0258522.1 VWA domain-containing protein [Gammaproteobacteria bacterium]